MIGNVHFFLTSLMKRQISFRFKKARLIHKHKGLRKNNSVMTTTILLQYLYTKIYNYAARYVRADALVMTPVATPDMMPVVTLCLACYYVDVQSRLRFHHDHRREGTLRNALEDSKRGTLPEVLYRTGLFVP